MYVPHVEDELHAVRQQDVHARKHAEAEHRQRRNHWSVPAGSINRGRAEERCDQCGSRQQRLCARAELCDLALLLLERRSAQLIQDLGQRFGHFLGR